MQTRELYRTVQQQTSSFEKKLPTFCGAWMKRWIVLLWSCGVWEQQACLANAKFEEWLLLRSCRTSVLFCCSRWCN